MGEATKRDGAKDARKAQNVREGEFGFDFAWGVWPAKPGKTGHFAALCGAAVGSFSILFGTAFAH